MTISTPIQALNHSASLSSATAFRRKGVRNVSSAGGPGKKRKGPRPPSSSRARSKAAAKSPPKPSGSRKSLQPDNLYRSSSSSTASAGGATIGPYGLQRVDYSRPPKAWPLPPHPPPRKNKVRRYFPLMTAAVALVCGVWIYIDRDDEVYEYWRQVEQGNVPVPDDEYDDDDDDDDDEED